MPRSWPGPDRGQSMSSTCRMYKTCLCGRAFMFGPLITGHGPGPLGQSRSGSDLSTLNYNTIVFSIIATYVVKKERREGNSPLVMSKAKRKGQWGGKVAPCCVENKKNTATRQLPPRRIKNKKNRATRRPLPPRCVENKKNTAKGQRPPHCVESGGNQIRKACPIGRVFRAQVEEEMGGRFRV